MLIKVIQLDYLNSLQANNFFLIIQDEYIQFLCHRIQNRK